MGTIYILITSLSWLPFSQWNGGWGAGVREEGMSCSRFYQQPSQASPLSSVCQTQGAAGQRAPQHLRTLLSSPARPLQLRRCPAAGAAGLHRLPARLQMPGGRREGQDAHPQEVWRRSEASTEVLGFHTGVEELRKPWREKVERNDALEGVKWKTGRSLEGYTRNSPQRFLEIVKYVFHRSCATQEYFYYY